VLLDRAGRLLSFRPGDPERGEVARRYVFAGAHVFSPELLARVGPGKSDIVRDLYVPMLAEGATIDLVPLLITGGETWRLFTPPSTGAAPVANGAGRTVRATRAKKTG